MPWYCMLQQLGNASTSAEVQPGDGNPGDAPSVRARRSSNGGAGNSHRRSASNALSTRPSESHATLN